MKLLVVEKQLLAGGKDEVLPAVHTLEYLVLEFHDPVIAAAMWSRQLPALLVNRTEATWAQPPKRLYCTCNNLWGRKLERGMVVFYDCRWLSRRHRGPAIGVYESAGPGGLPCCVKHVCYYSGLRSDGQRGLSLRKGHKNCH